MTAASPQTSPNVTDISNATNDICRREILLGVAYCPVFLFGLLVNAAALWASIAKRASWTDTHIYILNLIATDSALLVFLPFRIYDAFSPLTKSVLCTYLINIHYSNMYASIYTFTAISVHRYLAVRFPMRAKSWRRKKVAAFVVCLAIWVTVVSLCLIFQENSPDKLQCCFERCKDQRLTFKFAVMLVCGGFLAPLLIIVFCTSQIIFILLKDTAKSEERKNTISIVTANMVVFIICFTPIHTRFAFHLFSEKSGTWLSEELYLSLSEWIASTNCCFDSVSYYFLLKRFYT
ncbi:G-protein coupled receptor 35-like [Xyrichtys novacula]|uniref:G-protein coupled receptor 35-like n=1 Tax=Xyrichtys novacula TaxID=13765 RepID=A0AAV1GEI5_XYRNO|nr:G-protein coupled receptor 35-like [Xyrichtys novacula]